MLLVSGCIGTAFCNSLSVVQHFLKSTTLSQISYLNFQIVANFAEFFFLTVATFFTAIISIRKRLPKEIFTTIAWKMKIAACQHGKCVLRFATIRGRHANRDAHLQCSQRASGAIPRSPARQTPLRDRCELQSAASEAIWNDGPHTERLD